MDIQTFPVRKIDGTPIEIQDLDRSFDRWVHTGRIINVKKCSPDSPVARIKLRDPNMLSNWKGLNGFGNGLSYLFLNCWAQYRIQPNLVWLKHAYIREVYPITRHIRGRVILISNTGYQALKLLKNLFEQLQYKISINTEKTTEEVKEIIQNEASKDDNRYIDSFIVIIYGNPDNFNFGFIAEMLNPENAPSLVGKPKLLYVIGDEEIVEQVNHIKQRNNDPDYMLASTGFNGVMFYIYILCMFVHELSAQDIWRLMEHFAERHRFAASSHCTLTKEFYFFPGLTNSELSTEIENMDPRDMDLYLQMLEHSKMRTYNMRLMFVGLYGAGKSSTANRIMGKPIDGIGSTDGIDVYIGKCKVDIRNETWTILEDRRSNMPYTKLSKLLLTDEESVSKLPDIKNLENPPTPDDRPTVPYPHAAEGFSNQMPGNRQEYQAEYRPAGDGKKKRKRTDPDELDLSSPMSVESEISSPEVRSRDGSISSDFEMIDRESLVENRESLSIAQRVFQESKENRGDTNKEASVSLWDFAGQFIYYATHQLFFSPKAIYLLVMNMEEDLEKTILDNWYFDLRGKKSIDAQGGVIFWLRSIYSYAKGPQPGTPPIVLVGTHRDQLYGDVQEQRIIANTHFNKIRDCFKDTPLEYHIYNETFLLDNRTDDPELDKLKKSLIDIAKTMPSWGEEIPAKWVELEQALEDRREEGRSFISMDMLRKIDKGLARPINNDDQLRLFLRTHHENGTVIYFDDANIQDMIILDPQWIIHAFRYLIAADEFGKKYGHLENEWRSFKDSGKLELKLAQAIWQQDRQYDFYANHEKLLYFLEKLDIICRARVLKEDGVSLESLPFYYVPCLLTTPPNEMILTVPRMKNCISTPILCLAFRGNFLPPAIFNRLIAICLGRWPVARQGKHNLIFCGCAVFVVNHGKGVDLHRLTIFFRNSKIGIWITRYTTKGAKIVDENICDTVRRVITAAVRREFRRFQGANDQWEEPFMYQIQCLETTQADYLDDGLHNLEDLIETGDQDFFCDRHSDRFHPHQSDVVSLLKEWFPDKVPQTVRSSGISPVDFWMENLPSRLKNERVSHATLSKLTDAIGKDWQLFVIGELGLTQVDLDHIVEDHRYIKQQIYHSLRHWTDVVMRERQDEATNIELLRIMRNTSVSVNIDWERVQNTIDGIN